MKVEDAKIIELPIFLDVRGNLSYVQNYSQIPFEIKRTYWLYDVPGGVGRGGHAEINNEEVIIALSGAFDIVIDDGVNQKSFTLNRSYYGLYIPRGLWREIKEFSTNAVALEFGSIPYDVNDYIRDYDAFMAFPKNNYYTEATENSVSLVDSNKTHDSKKYRVYDCTMLELD